MTVVLTDHPERTAVIATCDACESKTLLPVPDVERAREWGRLHRCRPLPHQSRYRGSK